MVEFLPGIGLIVGLVSLVAAVRMAEQQARATIVVLVERDDARQLREPWSPAPPR